MLNHFPELKQQLRDTGAITRDLYGTKATGMPSTPPRVLTGSGMPEMAEGVRQRQEYEQKQRDIMRRGNSQQQIQIGR
jgi:hypothetical protein